jgi:sugar lactone lactonase YvrE
MRAIPAARTLWGALCAAASCVVLLTLLGSAGAAPSATPNLPVALAITGEVGGLGSDPGQFKNLVDVTLDNEGNLIVPDPGNNRVQKLARNGTVSWSRGAAGNKAGSGSGEFSEPKDAVVTPDGSIWVADSENSRLVKLSAGGTVLGMFPIGFVPEGIASVGDGTLLVSGRRSGYVRRYSAGAVVLTNYTTSGMDPLDVTYAGGFVYVADARNQKIYKFALAGNLVLTWGKEGEAPGDLKEPYGISATDDSIWVVDRSLRRLYEYAPDGTLRVQFGSGLSSPTGLFARGDDLVLADSGTEKILELAKTFAPPKGTICDSETGTCTLGPSGVPVVSVMRSNRSSVRFVNPADICVRLQRGASLQKRAFYNNKEYPIQRVAEGFLVEIPADELADSSLTMVSKCPPASSAFVPSQLIGDQATETVGETELHDPSGFVRDSKTKKGIPGALVVLEQGASSSGPFGFADAGSIRPRANPQRTNKRGHYGWDVPRGYWRIKVSRFGYFTLRASRVVSVPPPVTDLHVVLKPKPAELRRLIATTGAVGALKLGASSGAARKAARAVSPRPRLTFRRGKLVRIALRGGGFKSALGIGIGSTESDLRLAYGLKARRSRNTYRVGRVTFTVRGANGATGRITAVQIGS